VFSVDDDVIKSSLQGALSFFDISADLHAVLARLFAIAQNMDRIDTIINNEFFKRLAELMVVEDREIQLLTGIYLLICFVEKTCYLAVLFTLFPV